MTYENNGQLYQQRVFNMFNGDEVTLVSPESSRRKCMEYLRKLLSGYDTGRR